MTTKFEHLTDNDASLIDGAAELAKAQLLRAVSIVAEVSRRDENDVDSGLVAAVMQALATNYLALMISRRDFTA
jgi:hypothetical protein